MLRKVLTAKTQGRAFIVLNARLILARAVTVAVRYLSIRRQFRDRDDPDDSRPETAVLDYSTVQIRVLTLLATAFALHYGGASMWALYERTRSSNALDGDQAQLAELHSTSAGLKSLATDLAANGIETCRRAMGGHGFGGGTGLVQLNADYLSKPTVEGDNWMITQQAARFLINKVRDAIKPATQGGQSTTEANLREYYATREHRQPLVSLDDDAAISKAFQWRVSFFAFKAHEAREIQKRPWNSLLVDLYKLSRAYSQSMLVDSFLEGIQNANISAVTKSVLEDLYRLFALYTMDAEAREFQKSGAVSAEMLDSLPQRVLELMERIRPHAVRLVDSLAIPDYLLDSALGRYDGRVYEDLFHRAHVLNPLNRITFNPDYRTDEIVMGSGDGGEILAKL
jgi:acyl-CoA oxidase